MRYLAKVLVLLAMIALLCGVAVAQTVSVLPNAMTQFVDGNGVPYVGGRVYMYTPFTTTPKTTYQDPLAHTPNQNPITLDTNGRAVIWGSGEYRQILQDQYGTVVWDQLTYASPLTAASGGAIWYGSATGTANAITLATSPAFNGADGQIVGWIAAATNTLSTTINASGFGSVLVEKNTASGLAALSGGEVTMGGLFYATYSKPSNVFVLTDPTPATSATATAYSRVVTNAAGAQFFSPVVDVTALGAVGDGLTEDGAFVQNAFTAAAGSGGEVDFPCGVFKISQAITFTVPAGKHVTIRGGGADCTEVWFSGGAYGLTVNYVDGFGTISEEGLTWTTDQAGGSTANQLTNTHTIDGTNGLAGATNFYDVNYRGHDAYSGGTPTAYWGNGLSVNNVSNINVFGGECTGPKAAPAGICYSAVGTGTSQAVVWNFFGTTMYFCNTGFFYGDYVEGVTLHAFNATGCAYGVKTTANNVALIDQLAVVNSQFNATVCGVCINQTLANAVQISNSLFIMNANSTAIKSQGSLNTIIGNMITSGSTTGTTGISLSSNGTSGAGTLIENNTITGFATGVSVAAGVSPQAVVRNNTLSSNTTDYVVGVGATVVIEDHALRNLAAILSCTTGLRGSEFLQADGNAGAYDATATSGAADVVPIVCNGSNWKNH